MANFVIARQYMPVMRDGERHPVFEFTAKPYTHKLQDAAEQEARRLARLYDQDFAVFKRVSTIHVEAIPAEDVKPLTVEALARSLVDSMSRKGYAFDVEEARQTVVGAIRRAE